MPQFSSIVKVHYRLTYLIISWDVLFLGTSLYEINRVADDANTIVADLSNRIGLRVCDKDFDSIIN